MDERLRGAAHAGDINELYNCIREDGTVLKRMDGEEFVDTPLHIAAARGHSDFAIAMMYLKPSFGRKLNQDVYSPIHLALQSGNTETALRLLDADKDLVRVKGKEGYTALHYAAERENLDLLTRFLKDCPECVDDVTIRNETALHIAAQNESLGALEVLGRWLQRTHIYGKISRAHLLNSKDRDGNTVLHIAASKSQPQMIKLLLECKADMNEINMRGLTALDILEIQEQDHNRDICLDLIRRKGGLNASSVHRVGISSCRRLSSKITLLEQVVMGMVSPIMRMSSEAISTLLFGLTLVMTAILEGILNPPGGVWQGDISKDPMSPANARAGKSVMDPAIFRVYILVNYAVFNFAFYLIVALIQIVSRSSVITITTAILGALLTCSFGNAIGVIMPPKTGSFLHITSAKIRGFDLSPVAAFFLMVAIGDVIRRVCRMCTRWYHEL
ncbi:hypothetical protein PTKIN_Ptkin16aG0084300 [Pterospermum kingtungense]